MELNREIKRLNQIISKLKDTVLGIGKRLMELKDNLMKVRMHYGERNIAKRTSNTGRDARTYDRAAGTDTGYYSGTADGKSGLGTGRESNQGKGQTDQFAAVIGASIERRKRTIDEALERRKEIYERFERLQRLRSAGNAGADGANAGGTDGKDTDHTSIRERTTAASDLIRMAERAGADARVNDAASGAVIKDSQTGRAYREAERERQDSERQRKIKARKRGIDR